jgi:protease-4
MRRFSVLLVGAVVGALCGRTGTLAGPSATTQPAPVRNIIEMTLSGTLAERRAAFELFGEAPLSMGQVGAALERARTDPVVAGVTLRLASVRLGPAQVQTLCSQVAAVRAAGKQVFCTLEDAGHAEYLLAAACDRVALAPAGSLDLVGLTADVYFLKGLLDKIGVQADLIQTGSFKGAAEPLTRTSMSPELREQMTRLLDDLYEQMVAGIAAGRKLPAEKVKALIDEGPFTADEARKAGLIDWVVYPDEFDAKVKADLSGRTQFVKESFGRQTLPASVTSNPLALMGAVLSMLSPPTPAPPSGRPRIAVVYVTGAMVAGNREMDFPGQDQAASTPVCQALRQARRDESVRAVVLRIDSPGGSVLASDLIWHEVVECVKIKPLIVSMGDTAASGGYYIAAPATAIVAQPGTITGSIGVVGGKIVIRGLYEKIGIDKETITRGRRAAMSGEQAPFSEDERRVVAAQMRRVYDDFVAKVAAGRKMKVEQVEALAQGRIWSGAAAKRVGLVDELGGWDEAVRLAKMRAGLPADAEVDFLSLPTRKGWLEQLFGGGLSGEIGGGRSEMAALRSLGADPLRRIAPHLALGGILARERLALVLPFVLDIR